MSEWGTALPRDLQQPRITMLFTNLGLCTSLKAQGWNNVGLGLGYLVLSFITSSSKHTFTRISHGRTCVRESVWNVCLRFSCPAFPMVQWAFPPDKSPSLLTLFNTISISSWFHKHYKQDSMGAIDSHSLSTSLCLSLFLLLTVTSLVSWDRVTGETRPQTGPVREKSPKYSPDPLSPKKLLLHFNSTVLWIIMNEAT